MGDAHAIYNSSKKPVRWLNFAVSKTKGRADNFDLGDTRAGAAIDPVPVFVSGRLDQDKLGPMKPAAAGNSVSYRRVFGPDIFSTDWNHIHHLQIAADSTSGHRQLEGIEEVYDVIKGAGTFTINNEMASAKADDIFYGKLGEKITLPGDGKEEPELSVIGIAASKEKVLNILKPLIKPKSMALQMDFIVPKEMQQHLKKCIMQSQHHTTIKLRFYLIRKKTAENGWRVNNIRLHGPPHPGLQKNINGVAMM